ncbi:hypothetical protein E2320_015567, partial [Naja naja]
MLENHQAQKGAGDQLGELNLNGVREVEPNL